MHQNSLLNAVEGTKMDKSILQTAVYADYILSKFNITSDKLSQLVISGRLASHRIIKSHNNIDSKSEEPCNNPAVNNTALENNAINENIYCYKINVSFWDKDKCSKIIDWTDIVFDLPEAVSCIALSSLCHDIESNRHNIKVRERIRPINLQHHKKRMSSAKKSKLLEHFESKVSTALLKEDRIIALEVEVSNLKKEIYNLQVKDINDTSFVTSKQPVQAGQTKKAYRCGEITKAAAAKMCGVSERTFHSWETGERKPKISGFPGRSNLTTLLTWAVSYKDFQRMIKPAKAMGRAQSKSPDDIEKFATSSAWDTDD